MDYSKLKIGDKILIGGDSGFCTDGETTITDIKRGYCGETDKFYNIICCDEMEFSGKEGCGGAIRGPKAYYIKRKIKQTDKILEEKTK
jgi:hypothetical protein